MRHRKSSAQQEKQIQVSRDSELAANVAMFESKYVKRHASVMSMHVLYYSLWRSPGESTTRTVCKIYKSIREKDLPLCNHTYILVLFVSQRSICLKYEVQPCTRVLR